MFENMTVDEVMELAGRVGRRIAQEYPGVDSEDVMSEALARLVGRAETLQVTDEKYVYKILHGEASRYAAKILYDYMMAHANFVYTPREVRALLQEVFFDPTMWDVPTGKDDYLMASVSKKTVGISLMDLQEGWKKLKDPQRDVLLRRFRDDEIVTDTKAVTRAVEALTRLVNSGANRASIDHEGPGVREVLTSTRGQHHIKDNMEADYDYEEDAVNAYQDLREREPSKPAGTYYDWGSE